MRIEWPEKDRRRRTLAAGTLIGVIFWISSTLIIPQNEVARINYLTMHPEVRWMKGGSFLLLATSAAALIIDASHEKLIPSLQQLTGRMDKVFKDPLNWLIFALMTHSVYVENLPVITSEVFTILYLTAYQVTRT